MGALSLLTASTGFAVLETLRHFGLAATPGWSVLQAGFEAGMVGGCADWFAVSALFRPIPCRRFGLPHTNIIVTNRAKLSSGIVDMVQNRWLSPATLAGHLGQLSASGLLLELRNEPETQARLDEWARTTLLGLITSYHHVIGAMVASALTKLSDQDLVAQIEEKVGGDLQFIRLNGAVVGSAVGMLIALLKLALR